jgi:hypothetical protein
MNFKICLLKFCDIRYHDAHQLLSDNQQKWKIKLDRGMPDSDGDIPNVVSTLTHTFLLRSFQF